VEILAQRQGDFLVGEPRKLDHVGIIAGKLKAQFETLIGCGTVENDVAIVLCLVREGEVDGEFFGEFFLGRVCVHQLQPAQRILPEESRQDTAHQATPDDGDTVSQPRPGFPKGIEGHLHDAREHGTAGRHLVRDGCELVRGDYIEILVRVQAEDGFADPVVRALFYDADGQVAVLDRAWEVALLMRGVHKISHALRNAPLMHHALRAAADA
jgi:hypothetical protein